MSIVCSGSVAYDYLMRFPDIFETKFRTIWTRSVYLFGDDMVGYKAGGSECLLQLGFVGRKADLVCCGREDFDQYRKWLEDRS